MKQWLAWIVFGLLVIVSIGLGKKILAQSTQRSPEECAAAALQGDNNCDGDVNLFDYDIWKTRYLGTGKVIWPTETQAPTCFSSGVHECGGCCYVTSSSGTGNGQCNCGVAPVLPTPTPTLVPGSCQLNSECATDQRCVSGRCVALTQTPTLTSVPTLPVTLCKITGCVCTENSGCFSKNCIGGNCAEAQ